MFNKKDEDRKKKKHEADDLNFKISDRNKIIEENDIKLDQEKRKLDDKNLLKKQ